MSTRDRVLVGVLLDYLRRSTRSATKEDVLIVIQASERAVRAWSAAPSDVLARSQVGALILLTFFLCVLFASYFVSTDSDGVRLALSIAFINVMMPALEVCGPSAPACT